MTKKGLAMMTVPGLPLPTVDDMAADGSSEEDEAEDTIVTAVWDRTSTVSSSSSSSPSAWM